MPAADFFMPPDEMLAKRAAAVRRLLPEHLLRAAGVARLGALIDALGLPPQPALAAARVLVREGAAFPSSSGMTDGDFAKLLLVLDWCRAHRPAGIYLRSIPLEGIDTKWIERHAAIVCPLDDLTRPQAHPVEPADPAEPAGEAHPDADAPKRSAFERWQRRAGFRVLELPPLVLCRNTQAWLPAGAADADGADALARRAIQLPLAILQGIGTEYKEVLGVHILGPRATDLIGECALAIGMEATVEDIIAAIHAHPTVTEAVREAALAAEKRAIHIPNK